MPGDSGNSRGGTGLFLGTGAGTHYQVVPAIAHDLGDILFHAHANWGDVFVHLPVPSPVYIYMSDDGGFSRQYVVTAYCRPCSESRTALCTDVYD